MKLSSLLVLGAARNCRLRFAAQRRVSACGALADAATGAGCIAEIQKLARLAKLQPVSPRP